MTAGFVACGHDAVAAAAAAVLEAGGNAFDACIAAGFAGAVAEPGFTSLAGGGFLLAHIAGGEEVVFDFFVNTPGLGLGASDREPHFLPVNVQFIAAEQVFHAGLGSVAVPGCLAGYLHVHRRLGRLALSDVVAPAVALARRGVTVDATTAEVLGVLAPILLREPESAAIVAPRGQTLRAGEVLVNPALADFLEALGVDERATFYRGDLAVRLVAQMADGAGLVTMNDLAAYEVVERPPLVVQYRGAQVATNPPPSFGGALIALALRIEEECGAPAEWQSPEQLVRTVEVMVEVDRRRREGGVTKGTTQMSVADGEGNVASMTTSNGETSGDVIPGTGVLLNNMLGEDDLHPDGFHVGPPGPRVPSMMAPTIVRDGGGPTSRDAVTLALGSGGSKRIRTAITQVITAVVAHQRDVGDAVTAPRAHWDGEVLQLEPGLPERTVDALRARWPLNEWPVRNLYFGGVHAVRPGSDAAGDPRRGGAVRTVE